MSETYRILVTWDDSMFNELFYNIRKAIHEVHSQNLSEEGIRINMPNYLVELIQRNPNLYLSNPLGYEEGKTKIFGYPVYPSFENMIVVFHVDMPLYGNTVYRLIDLKKIK